MAVKRRPFHLLHKRLRELDFTYTEFAGRIGLSLPAFSQRMNGHTPFTEPEMQRCLSELGKPEETLADLFERRTV